MDKHRRQLTLRCEGVKAPEYGSGSGLSSHASARKPPHCPEGKWEAEEHGLSEEKNINRKAIRKQLDAYKSAVSEQLDIVLLTDICHAVERAGVNQRELYHKERMSIRSFFSPLFVRPSDMYTGYWRQTYEHIPELDSKQ